MEVEAQEILLPGTEWVYIITTQNPRVQSQF